MLFPRFFFLSDDELLEIISQAKNVQAVQPHLKKCFENIYMLKFDNDLSITHMYSAEHEEVPFVPAITPTGNVEDWLGQVEIAMRDTLKRIIGDSLKVVEVTPRKVWVYMGWPGQVVLCGSQTSWTAHVEDGIRTQTLNDYYHRMLNQVRQMHVLASVWCNE